MEGRVARNAPASAAAVTRLSRTNVASPTARTSLVLPVSRTNQFDAAKLDADNMSTLKQELKKVFVMMPDFLSDREPELVALLQFFVWALTICADKPTPGCAMMNLRYRNEKAFQSLALSGEVRTGLEGPGLTRFQKFGFLLAMVGVPYEWARWQNSPASQKSPQNPWASAARWLHRAENVYRVASFANFALFLHTGRYQSLVDRVLSASLVYQKPNAVRTVSSELMNRQLVWNEFSELLLAVLPLMSWKNVERVLRWPFSSNARSAQRLDPEKKCLICSAEPITVPYGALPCGHVYCYYCLRTRCTAQRSF